MISPWKLTTFHFDNDLFGIAGLLFLFLECRGFKYVAKGKRGEASESRYSDR